MPPPRTKNKKKMLGLGGFKRKPRGFGFKPAYWDQDKEEREERRKAVLGDEYVEGDSSYKPGSLIRDSRLRRMRSANRTQRASRSTLIRVALFVALAAFALYFLTDLMSVFAR